MINELYTPLTLIIIGNGILAMSFNWLKSWIGINAGIFVLFVVIQDIYKCSTSISHRRLKMYVLLKKRW